MTQRLRQVPQVIGVQARGGGVYLVDSAPGTDLRAELARLAVEQGWGLLELAPLEMTLEDVFHALTQQKGSAA